MTAAPDVVTVSGDGLIREVFLTQGARKFADEFEQMSEAHVLGHMVTTVALLEQAIRNIAASQECPQPVRDVALEHAVFIADEARNSLTGYRVGSQRRRERQREENALSTVQWPASMPADGAA